MLDFLFVIDWTHLNGAFQVSYNTFLWLSKPSSAPLESESFFSTFQQAQSYQSSTTIWSHDKVTSTRCQYIFLTNKQQKETGTKTSSKHGSKANKGLSTSTVKQAPPCFHSTNYLLVKTNSSHRYTQQHALPQLL